MCGSTALLQFGTCLALSSDQGSRERKGFHQKGAFVNVCVCVLWQCVCVCVCGGGGGGGGGLWVGGGGGGGGICVLWWVGG